MSAIETLLVDQSGSALESWASAISSGLGDPLNAAARLLAEERVTTVTLRLTNGNRRHYRRKTR